MHILPCNIRGQELQGVYEEKDPKEIKEDSANQINHTCIHLSPDTQLGTIPLPLCKLLNYTLRRENMEKLNSQHYSTKVHGESSNP